MGAEIDDEVGEMLRIREICGGMSRAAGLLDGSPEERPLGSATPSSALQGCFSQCCISSQRPRAN